MCPHCGFAHAPSTLPPCTSCGRMDCVHSPVPPHSITVLRPECAGFGGQEPFEGGGGQFGGGGASGGPW
jgi:hypothetical protein